MRTATVVATDYCELYSLSRSDLEAVVASWPELAAQLDKLIEGFRQLAALTPSDFPSHHSSESSSMFPPGPDGEAKM